MTSFQGRTWMFLCLAASGAAGMSLGPDGWPGFDIGPVGAAVLYAALWLFTIHVWKHAVPNPASRRFAIHVGMSSSRGSSSQALCVREIGSPGCVP